MVKLKNFYCFFLFLCCPVLVQSGPGVTAKEFEAEALPKLPVEESFDFLHQLTQGLPPHPRDAGAMPRADEIEMGAGWEIVIHEDATMPLQTAAHELQNYLREAMAVTAEVRRVSSIQKWCQREQVILAAARDKFSGDGDALKDTKDYRITVNKSTVTVCGFDDCGAMYGLYNLMMRFRLREAPFLPQNLDSVRHSLYQARITQSGLGWMDWPERYMATLPLYGFDSIFIGGRNFNNIPGPEPYWTDASKRKHEPGAIKDLMTLASRYGVGVYAPFIYLYTGTPENIAGLRHQVREILGEFPDIRGFILCNRSRVSIAG